MIGSSIGSYRIVRLLGSGGTGSVYEGEHQTSRQSVAIKVLNAASAESPAAVARFLNEAHVVNSIKHPRLVEILEVGRQPDGPPFLVMELLTGQTLRQRLDSHGAGTPGAGRVRLPLDFALRCAQQIAQGLAAAHGKHVIHRDLKPSNVMLLLAADGAESIKLLDFGLAKLNEPDEEQALTQTGTLMGTPAYMSPEQCRSACSVTDRSDVYSLGVLLYELLIGERPFVGASDFAVIYQHLTAPPPDPRARVPDLPEGLARLVLRMLAKAPAERPSAQEVASGLARTLGVPSSAALPLFFPDANAAQPDEVQRESHTGPGRRVILWSVMLLGLGSGLLATVLHLRRAAPLPSPSVPPAEPIRPTLPAVVTPAPAAPALSAPASEPSQRRQRGTRPVPKKRR